MRKATFLHILLLIHVAFAALPRVDFDRMGKVGLAGSFAGLALFQNSSSVSFDPSTSTLLVRSSDGSLSPLASTNSGGQILAGCALGDIFYLAGLFSSIGTTSATNVVSYSQSSGSFAALGSGGPNDEVSAVFCDEKDSKLWVGGRFTSPASSVAVWDIQTKSWSSPPFSGLSGAQARVLSITSNSSQSSLFFAGSFITSFQGPGSILNGTNNPNVPYSAGATPFSSSLVPIPLQNAQIDGSPSSSDPSFSSVSNILCPSGPDGPGDTWLAADGNTALITIRTFTSMSISGIRLGNTFLSGHGTTGFSVTSIPDNTVQLLTYIDPITQQNQTCTTNCPLSTDSSILYQDFLFDTTLDITGVQIDLSEWTGAAPGLHILQLLSSGAFASAISSDNAQSCFAPNPSNTSSIGNWTEKVANTNISGTIQSVLTAFVDVGTPAAQAPSFTWIPYVSAAGQYIINLLVPGCTGFQDCPLRTTVKVTVFPGQGLEPWVTTVSQQNSENAAILVYNGPILPSSPNFVTMVTLTLADQPAGQGEGGKYELVADRVQMILTSANAALNNQSGSNGNGGQQGGNNGFGFFEWPLSSSVTADATKILPNSTETSLDTVGFILYNSLGGSSLATSAITTVACHSSGTVFLGGNFTLTSGAANIIAFRNGALSVMPGNGLNGPVLTSVVEGDLLFVGGSFTDTSSSSLGGKLGGIAIYDVKQNEWVPLQAGVNGVVTSLGFSGGQVQLAGSFSTLLSSPNSNEGDEAAGLAAWDVGRGEWVNSGGYLVGSMTFVGNGSSSQRQKQSQFVAGNVLTSLTFGASGFVMIQNGDSNEPDVTPLGLPLNNVAQVSPGTSMRRREPHSRQGPAAWIQNLSLSNLFARQTTTQLPHLPVAQPALAPSVLAGTFWTNTSTSHEVVIIGGNFTFTASSGPSVSQGVAIYDPESTALFALQGSQINGTVRSLLVQDNILYIGGEFILQGTTANGFAIYNLATQQWDVSGIQPLQASTGSTIVVRSITTSSSKANTVIVAGTFAQAGSLLCQSICALDTNSKKWHPLGDGIQGEVASVGYAGDNESTLIASGSVALSDNTGANVAQFNLKNGTWSAVGDSTTLPGPVTAVAVNDGNASSIFAAGRSDDGSSSFLSFWNGASWTSFGSTLQASTNVSQLTMVPLQDTHTANGVVEPDRMLMISGLLEDSSFGSASSALFDGQTIIPYITSITPPNTPGTVYSVIHSFSTFSFVQHHFLAVGVVILICIAIAAGIVFLIALAGILWTLFSGRDDRATKLDMNDFDEDDNSSHNRPSSLLEHINVATRTTILGTRNLFNTHKEEKATTLPGDHDLFGPDASNYIRAETPSDVAGGILAAEEESSRPAHARYSFDGTGEGELPLSAGMEVEVLDDRDTAWWYARDIKTGKEGVVPAAYVY